MVIQTPDQRLRVFISSAMKEMAAERVAARTAVEQLRLAPVLFELGARPHPPRDLYLAYIRQSSVFVAIYGNQYGWVAPGMDVSGLEDEYRAAADLPKLIYIRESASDRDPRLEDLLGRISSDGLSYRRYATPAELGTLLSDDLAVLISERLATAEGGLAASPPSRSLPAAISTFVGRERELGEVRALLDDPDVRLITLTGPGGVGKTRLALEAARSPRHFSDGAIAVMLASVRRAELVPDAVRTALGIPENTGRTATETLVAHLASRNLLLLLDNVEHVIAASTVVADVLAAAPGVKVLATSREVLRISGEHVIVVPPLPLPAETGPVDAVAESDAVRLFLDRARAARRGLPVDDAQIRTIAGITRRLDGLPLAIELAAARARMLDPGDIARLLDQRIDLLNNGPRDLPARQRTLRAAMQWSLDLLDEGDRTLFARLCVFTGSFSLEAAEAICAGGPEPELLDRLAALVDKSLLRVDSNVAGHARFAMLETVAEYGREQLVTMPDAEQVHSAHAQFFHRLVRDHESDFDTGAGQELVPRYLADEPNLRAAMRWWLDHNDVDRVAQMGLALWRFWWIEGLYSEGMRWMQEALAMTSTPASAAAHARFVIGMLAFGRGDYDRAAPALEAAVTHYEGSGEQRSVATSSVALGVMRALAEPDAGTGQIETAVTAFRMLSDTWGLTFALLSLGGVHLLRNEPDAALAPLEEGIAYARMAGTDVMLINASVHVGLAHLRLGDVDAARRALHEALERAADHDNRESLARVLDAMAELAVALDAPERAAMILGAADALRSTIGANVWAADRSRHDHTAAVLRDALGEPAHATMRRGAQLAFRDLLDTVTLIDSADQPATGL